MPLSLAQCGQVNSYLGSRPYDWSKKIAADRKPFNYTYTGIYATEKYPNNFGTNMFFERTYNMRPNNPGLWQPFVTAPCIGTPCAQPRTVISQGVDQFQTTTYIQEYTSDVFCLDQLNTIEEVITKLGQVMTGMNKIPDQVCSDFLRALTLRRAGTQAQGAGLFLAGISDTVGNPVAIDISDNMFQVSAVANTGTAARAGVTNVLFCNLNANGGLTALGKGTTALLQAAMGQLTMEYLGNFQEDLAANGYHDSEWLQAGKFSITSDSATMRRLLNANPALTTLYRADDFQKNGQFYSYGVANGCGDWLFKQDTNQMRFIFRGDLDGKDLAGGSTSNSVWIQQVWPYENVSATYGSKPVFSQLWKNAPIRMYHCYNRDARKILVSDIASVNDEMKFGLARSFMGEWKWMSPDYFTAVDPTSGTTCSYLNDKRNYGYMLGEYRMGIQTWFPEIERVILALGESQQFVRIPNTNSPSFGPPGSLTGPGANEGYQSLASYNSTCYQSVGFNNPPLD